MNKSKVMSTLMAGAMLVSSALPVVAAETKSCKVTYSQTSTYSVTIPENVSLGTDKTGTYNVTVSGEIASNKKVVVAPETSFTMTNKDNTSEKVTANVTQVTDWSASEVATKTKKTGTIEAQDLTAGNWEGSLTFTIDLQNA